MSTQICPNCSKAVPASAKYCLECATPLPAKYASGQRASDQIAATLRNIRHMLLPCAIVALVVMTVTAFVLAKRVHEDSNQMAQLQTALARATTLVPGSHNATVPGTTTPAAAGAASAPNTATNANPIPAANVTTPSASNGTVLPPPADLPSDAADYLKYLQQVETRRAALQQESTAVQNPPAPTPGTPAPANATPETDDDIAAKWQELLRDFHDAIPPQSCVTIAADYDALLEEESVESGKNAASAPAAPDAATPSPPPVSKDLITMAQRVNDDITFLCSRYNAPKPVIVQVDTST